MSCPDFMRWVVERGAQNFGVYAEQCLGEAGKGLFAGTDFREGEILMCVPSSLIITAGVVADMAGYDGLFKRCRLQPFEALVCFFLVEDQESSDWAPYLSVLPTTFSTPAVLYPDLEPEHFPSGLGKIWAEQKDELKTIYKKLLNVLPDNISWSRFIWAWHVVNTRCIYRENKFHPLVDNSQGDALAIVPLIDMLNHSNENQCCAVWDNKLNLYRVLALRPVHKGEQIFICYGSHTNGSLWIDYGFFLKDNICNKVDLSLGLSLYATDTKTSFGFKANLALVTMDFTKLKHWPEIIYEEVEKNANSEAAVRVLCLLRDEMIKNGSESPEEVQWLWNEQIALLDALLRAES